MNPIRAGIIGGAGYTGGEMIRLLIRHPNIEIRFSLIRRAMPGKPVHSAHEDVLFSEAGACLRCAVRTAISMSCSFVWGMAEAKKFLDEAGNQFDGVRVIDLSQDFRLHAHQWVYGLPELNREAIRESKAVANPGCFATAIELGLLPLAKERLLKEVYTTGITGSTGAGQGLSATGHFSWRANNIQAYKTLTLFVLPQGNRPNAGSNCRAIPLTSTSFPGRGLHLRVSLSAANCAAIRAQDELYKIARE